MSVRQADDTVQVFNDLIKAVEKMGPQQQEAANQLREARSTYLRHKGTPTSTLDLLVTDDNHRSETVGILYGEIGRVTVERSSDSPAVIRIDSYLSKCERKPAWLSDFLGRIQKLNTAITNGKAFLSAEGRARQILNPRAPRDFELLGYSIECASAGRAQLRPFVADFDNCT